MTLLGSAGGWILRLWGAAVEPLALSSKSKWLGVLRGPRFVDAPFRVFLLLIGLAGLTPASFELSEPVYLVFQLLGALLVVSVCFAPMAAGLVGYVMFIIFASVYPDLVNPFQTVGEAVVAFVLSQLRIRLFLLFSVLLFGIVLIPTSLGVWGGDDESLLTLVFGWVLAVVLGLVAAGFERRIQAEISRRAELASVHERKLERVRLDMALDTHDTISHGLAAGAAIVRMLGIDARHEGRKDPKLTELALVTAHTQQQLRVLLARLTEDPDGRSTVGAFDSEMLSAAEMIRSATEAGGFTIDIREADLPSDVPAEALEAALFILKELATNIVKHATAPSPCSIVVRGDKCGGQERLRFEATNPSLEEPRRTPRSLTARVERAGGLVKLRHANGILTVVVDIPVREETTL